MVVPSLPVDVEPLQSATDCIDPPLDRDEECITPIHDSLPAQVIPPSTLTTPLTTSTAVSTTPTVHDDQRPMSAAVDSPPVHHGDVRVSTPPLGPSSPPDGPGGAQSERHVEANHLPTCLNETPPCTAQQPPPTPTADATSRSGRHCRPPGWLVKDYELKF